MTHSNRSVDRPLKGDTENTLSLSSRQMQILHLIAQGRTNVQIAEELDLSKHTVDAYCRRILLKFKTSSRVTAAVKASQMGLISNV
ncbi:MAG: response regulator transcription factor [Acidimicrobiales bacterium]|nr:response regulator transcription factor [Hyphomonadaceae bacterium]RZV42884.1 MAG: response regulator transcription factor [Acidimicrobiales bacterium]